MPIFICGIVAVGEKDKSTRYKKTATLYTRDPAVIRKLDSLVTEYPDTFKRVGETDIDKTYEMPKSAVTYRKPRRITDERRDQMRQLMKNINSA